MGTFLSYFSKVFGAVGSAVDTAVPVSTGNRTAGAVLAGVALQAIPSLLPLIPTPRRAGDRRASAGAESGDRDPRAAVRGGACDAAGGRTGASEGVDPRATLGKAPGG